jgi:ferredoxin
MSKKRAAVLIGLHLVFALHLAHLWTTGKTLTPLEPSEAMEFSKHSIVNAGLVFFLAAILATTLFGRFFCGWGCHLVALQDLCRTLLLKFGIRPRPLRSRFLALVPIGAFLYMFVWPLAVRGWLGDDFAIRAVEFQTSDFWATFPGWGVTLLTFGICGFIVVYLLGAKGFCTYACPYGAIFGAVDRLAPGRIRVTDACEGCGHCTATCSSNVQVAREVREYGMVVDPGCMKCMDCVSVCPKDALYFGFGRPAIGAAPRVEKAALRPPRPTLSWGEECLAALVFLGAFFSFRGLYGRVPFLLSLGIGAGVAFVVLQLTRLARRKGVALPGLTLADARGMRASGWAFVGVGLAVIVLSTVRWLSWRSTRLFEGLAEERAEWFASETQNPAQSPAKAVLGVFADLGRDSGRALSLSLIDDPRLLYQHAWSRLAQGDSEGFIEDALRARRGGLGSSELLLDMARVHRARGDLRAAEPLFAQVARGHPDLAAGWAGQAECMALRGALAEARATLEEGRRRSPDSSRLIHDLAVVETAAGRVEPAIELLREALRLDPAFQEARIKLATLLEATGHPEEARQVRSEGEETP